MTLLSYDMYAHWFTVAVIYARRRVLIQPSTPTKSATADRIEGVVYNVRRGLSYQGSGTAINTSTTGVYNTYRSTWYMVYHTSMLAKCRPRGEKKKAPKEIGKRLHQARRRKSPTRTSASDFRENNFLTNSGAVHAHFSRNPRIFSSKKSSLGFLQ